MEIKETGRVRMTMRQDERGAVAGISGELDFAGAPGVQTELSDLLARHGGLSVDLSGLTFMDSSGLHVFDGLRAQAARHGWPLEVTGAAGGVAKLLALVR